MYLVVVCFQIVILYNLHITCLGKVMEIPLVVCDNKYSQETINKWKTIWSSICDMCYTGINIQEEIITNPGYFQVDDEVMMNSNEKEQSIFYGNQYPTNDKEITLDYTWKEYSQKADPGVMPSVVPEFKHLHVPIFLFYTFGVDAWFSHSFPNCKVTFWEN